MDETPGTGGRTKRRPLRWVIGIGLGLALLHFGLRFENEIVKRCRVCASEHTVRQWGYALSRTMNIWRSTPSEVTVESDAAKRFLGPEHAHAWNNWLGRRTGGVSARKDAYTGIRMNPATEAWRENERFRSAFEAFAEDRANLPLVTLSLHLPFELDPKSPNKAQEDAAVKAMVPLFEKCGQTVPDDWRRVAAR